MFVPPGVAMIVMPVVATANRRVAVGIESEAMSGDSKQADYCTSALQNDSEKVLRIVSRAHHYTCMEHIDEHDLERYHLGMIEDEAELAPFEEHLLACAECAERAEEAAGYV